MFSQFFPATENGNTISALQYESTMDLTNDGGHTLMEFFVPSLNLCFNSEEYSLGN